MTGFNRPIAIAALMAGAAALAMPAHAGNARDALRGAAIGGAGGAVVGAVVPGLSVVDGALVGAAGGAAVGLITKNGKQRKLYRDERGNRYWVDDRGRRHYQ